jgi:hypothetical protein
MSTSNVSGVDSQAALDAVVEVRMAKMSNDAQKAEGEAALKLIQGAQPSVPPPSADGKGSVLNRYA